MSLTRALAVSSLLAACASPATAPASSEPWTVLALRDLASARAVIEANHPGVVDAQGAAFRDWLDRGYAQAVARARTIRSFGGYAATLAGFAEGFRDGHLGLWPTVAPQTLRTPGFLVGLRDGAVVVRETAPGGPAVGSRLVACDGVSAADLLARDVFPFHQHGADLEATWIRAAPWLLVDDDNPFRTRPQRCRLRGPGGDTELALTWSDRDAGPLRVALDRAAFGVAPEPQIRMLEGDGVWISIPQFWGDAEQETFLRRVIAEAASWRGKQRVVFDLRGNTGGSSEWGVRILTGLFGEARIEAIPDPSPPVFVEWRASPGNLAYLRQLSGQLAVKFGADSQIAHWALGVVSGLEGAIAGNRPLWAERGDEAPAAASPPPPAAPTPIPRAVYLVTDGRCASACLDFVTVARALPHVEHVGWPTAADSPYMDIRSEPLPSRLASCAFAMKVYRNQPRSNRPYDPQRRFPGEISDTGALERWIAGLPPPP